MKKLSDSSLFKEMLAGPRLAHNLQALDLNRDKIELSALAEQINTINKKMNFATKGKIFEYLNSGNIMMVANPEVSLPKYLNTFGRITGNGLTAVIDISKYAVIRANGIDIFPRTLYGLLQNGVVLLELSNNWNKYTMNIEFIKNAAISYAKLVGKVLDKTFAINVEPVKSDMIHFYLAKFFLINLCEKGNNDTTNNIAHKACFNGTKMEMILEEEKMFDETAFNSIFELFNNLKKINGLENLKIRSFVENWVRMYGEGTILALDYLPAFVSMIFSVSIGAGLHRDHIIDSVCSRTNSRMLFEFSKLMR